jgi:hypothetical protein
VPTHRPGMSRIVARVGCAASLVVSIEGCTLGVGLASFGDNTNCRATFSWSVAPR